MSCHDGFPNAQLVKHRENRVFMSIVGFSVAQIKRNCSRYFSDFLAGLMRVSDQGCAG
jgi:hypothetical protein